MIHSGRIQKTLKFLEGEYQKSLTHSDEIRSVLFAKLALIEYCGWIEGAFDDIARNCVRSRLRSFASRRILEDKIKRTHGFTYNENTRPMLAVALGTIRLLEVERQLARHGRLEMLKSELSNLNQLRREAAHNFTSATHSYSTPSYFLDNHRRLEPVLQDLRNMVRCDE